MLNAGNKLIAQRFFMSGSAFVQQELYEQAISELLRAEELFRDLDARGHPFNHILENGISGLANTCFLLGICYQRTGDLRKAIARFETSLINKRFERTLPFRRFQKTVHEHLAACYEEMLAGLDDPARETSLNEDPPLDIAFRFPFSLDTRVIPLARLYEIEPSRYLPVRAWYEQARKKDAALRRANSRTDDATMRKISIGVWSVIASIWVLYGIIVLRTLSLHR